MHLGRGGATMAGSKVQITDIDGGERVRAENVPPPLACNEQPRQVPG